MTLYVGNDCNIILEDIFDPAASSGDGEYITSASSATAQIYQMDGSTTIGGAITLTYQNKYDGVTGHYWIGIVEEDHAALVDGTSVVVVSNLTASSDRVLKIRQVHQVRNRT